MDVFYLTLKQMLMMFSLIAFGFFLRKKSILPDNSGTTMAKMETWIFVPALYLFTQTTKCTVENFKENSKLILYGFVIVMAALILSYPLSRLFVRNYKDSPEDTYRRNIYKYALVFGNYGFMGNYIILGIWGDDVYYQYSLFTFIIGIICSSWGLFILIPKDKSAGVLANLKKGFITPPMISLILGMALGLTGFSKFVPDFLTNAFESASKCQGPVAMVLAGFIIGGYNFKKLCLNKKVYIATLMRLIVIPSLIMIVLNLLGTEKEIMRLALIAFATPLGMNTIVYPAAYGGETETGASMTMISHTLSVITIPLMYLIFIA